MEFRDVFVFIWCLFLPLTMSASLPDKTFCSKNSSVNTRFKPAGKIVFPSTSFTHIVRLCRFRIYSPVDSETELTLVNLQRAQSQRQCNKSYVEIYSNYNRGRGEDIDNIYCKSVGSVATLTLKASTINMLYRASSIRNDVHTNSTKDAISIHYKRKRIGFNIITSPTMATTKDTKPKSCRHVLRNESGTFQTYGYPYYPLGGECEWVISTDSSEGIVVEFRIRNNHHLNCENNYIEVREGDSITAPLLERICKPIYISQPKKIQSSSSKLWIRIKSSSTYGIGVQASYKPQTCKVVTAINEQFDFKSPIGTSCKTWTLTAPPSYIAAVSFTHVKLESLDSTVCLGNVLEVWDGKNKSVYCNNKPPPSIITSKGQKLVVTFRSKSTDFIKYGSFQASFTSISPSSFKTNCFVQDRELRFRCNNRRIIPCNRQCDGDMQCSDNSDEILCSDTQARWHKLQLFVIVMGSVCASTVIFCVGLVCFRKCILNDGSPSSSRRSRRLSISDESPLTPHADLPSPPPCYFTDRDEEPPASVIRGTYFFGDEFSQSGIHSASLFGIPPPRYRSTESLHRSNPETRSIWQRGISSIPLVTTDTSRNVVNTCLSEEDPPDYESVSADKDEHIIRSTATQSNDVSFEAEECIAERLASSSNELIANDLGNDLSIELETHVPSPSNGNHNLDIGITNAGATINV